MTNDSDEAIRMRGIFVLAASAAAFGSSWPIRAHASRQSLARRGSYGFKHGIRVPSRRGFLAPAASPSSALMAASSNLWLQLRGGFTRGELLVDLGFLSALLVPVVRNEIVLRMVTLSSSLFFLMSALLPYPHINWAAVLAQCVLITRGCRLLVSTIAERRVSLSADEVELYHSAFEGDLTVQEYRALLDCGGSIVEAQEGEVIVAEQSPDADFAILAKGMCNVFRRSRKIDTLGPGDFFGNVLSVAAKQKEPLNATETVIAASEVTYIKWDTDKLLQIMAQKPSIRAAVLSVIGKDEAKKFNRMDWDDVREMKRKWFQPTFLPAVPPEQLPGAIVDAVADAFDKGRQEATDIENVASSPSQSAA